MKRQKDQVKTKPIKLKKEIKLVGIRERKLHVINKQKQKNKKHTLVVIKKN